MTKSMWFTVSLAGMAWIGALLFGPGPKAATADRWGEAEMQNAAEAPAAAREPDLVAACLTRAHLPDADLRGANLIAASLAQAHLVGAHLQHANLSGATLCQAHLIGADLRGANLADACLAGADLAGADLAGALYDDRTQWPAGFDPAAHGARRIE